MTSKVAALPTGSFPLFRRLFPYTSGNLGDTAQNQIDQLIRRLEMPLTSEMKLEINQITKNDDSNATITFDQSLTTESASLNYPITASQSPSLSTNEKFYADGGRAQSLASLMMSLSAGDVAIIGERGVGKQTLSRELSRLLDQPVEPILLYQDMSSRDLLQQRDTDVNGNTVWRHSPLVKAAVEGRLALIDGIDRLYPGTLALIQRLTQDRELTLHDGTRLLGADRFEQTAKEANLNEDKMKQKGLLKIHPAFRICAFAERPSTKNKWLTPEIIPSFIWHELSPLDQANEAKLLQNLAGLNPVTSSKIAQLAHNLRNSHDDGLRSVAKSYSTKQLLRISRRIATFPQLNLQKELERAAMSRFLPLTTQVSDKSFIN